MKTKVSTEYDGKPRTLYAGACAHCKTEIWRPRHRLTESSCCSAACRGKYKQQRSGSELICAHCGESFWRQNSRVKNSRSGLQFCSRTCKETAQSWQGGCLEIRPSHYGDVNNQGNYGRLKSGVCVDCGESRLYLLTVHHRNGDRANNMIENLETVCWNDHIRRHLKNIDGTWIVDFKAITPVDQLAGV